MWGQPDELVECYTDSDCLSATTPLLMTRRECCVDTPGDTGFRTVGSETCNITFCVGTYNIIAYMHSTATDLVNEHQVSLAKSV